MSKHAHKEYKPAQSHSICNLGINFQLNEILSAQRSTMRSYNAVIILGKVFSFLNSEKVYNGLSTLASSRVFFLEFYLLVN